MHCVNFQDNEELSRFTGLSNLVGVGTSFDIIGNSKLIDLAGLDMLNEVGSMHVTDNPVMSSLQGLDSLMNVNQDLVVMGNDAISLLNSFPKLAKVGGELEIGSEDSLTDISGFPSLVLIGGSLIIESNHKLTALSGFSALTDITLDLNIEDNIVLCETDAESFAQGIAVGGTTTISGNEGCP